MIEIIGKLLAAVVVALIAYIEPIIKAWITAKVEQIKNDKLRLLVLTFVDSAEQQYKEPKSGAQKKEYVITELKKLGYELTEELNAMIESAVYNLGW